MKMYDKIFNFKFLPPGRGLWAMGTKITEEKGLYAALNNCAFVST
jgi:ribonucleoside-triphosphate reductase (thioredoxin)